MKTILYQPIFINPQAYYVFPQLTQIEPDTDEYIEKVARDTFGYVKPYEKVFIDANK